MYKISKVKEEDPNGVYCHIIPLIVEPQQHFVTIAKRYQIGLNRQRRAPFSSRLTPFHLSKRAVRKRADANGPIEAH